MSIVSISGRLNSGKDTVGKIALILLNNKQLNNEGVLTFIRKDIGQSGDWTIERWAAKVKDIVCLLIGYTREQLEDRDLKEKELGEEWWYIKHWYPANREHKKVFTLIPYIGFDSRMFDGDNSCMWEVVKTTPRLLMQLVGTDCGRNILHPNIWCTSLFTDYKVKQVPQEFLNMSMKEAKKLGLLE